MAAAIVDDSLAHLFGHALNVEEDGINGFLKKCRIPFEGLVQNS